VNVRIHPTAVVEDGSMIGEGTVIWHHVHVRCGARIGADCTLGKNVFVDAAAVVGDRVKIQNNVSVFSGVVLANDVFVGPSAVFTNDRFPRAFSTNWKIIDTFVDEGASVGAGAVLVCGIRIGRFATVAAGSVVTRSVEPFQVVAGNPARPMGWVCRCGRVVSRGVQRPESLEECRCG
jgi:UDP-2-acetamido-3-amino-2,3-dideoxy-glucuronate N-acetyltransferase